jgi:hypothetical protein
VAGRSSDRLLLFLYSTRNIVGSALGLIGLLLFFTGVIGALWFVIVPGLYLIGLLGVKTNPKVELKLSGELDAERIRGELEGLMRKIRDQVPPDILRRVFSIKESIVNMLPQLMQSQISDYNVFTIRKTALEYLPETLENYLNLPKAYANFHPVRDGKTASQLLVEQLQMLDGQMKEIAQDLYRNDTEKMMAHGRFLEEKFDSPDIFRKDREKVPSRPAGS